MCMAIAPNPQPKKTHTPSKVVNILLILLIVSNKCFPWPQMITTDRHTHFQNAVLCVAGINVGGVCGVYVCLCFHWVGFGCLCVQWLLRQTKFKICQFHSTINSTKLRSSDKSQATACTFSMLLKSFPSVPGKGHLSRTPVLDPVAFRENHIHPRSTDSREGRRRSPPAAAR